MSRGNNYSGILKYLLNMMDRTGIKNHMQHCIHCPHQKHKPAQMSGGEVIVYLFATPSCTICNPSMPSADIAIRTDMLTLDKQLVPL